MFFWYFESCLSKTSGFTVCASSNLKSDHIGHSLISFGLFKIKLIFCFEINVKEFKAINIFLVKILISVCKPRLKHRQRPLAFTTQLLLLIDCPDVNWTLINYKAIARTPSSPHINSHESSPTTKLPGVAVMIRNYAHPNYRADARRHGL